MALYKKQTQYYLNVRISVHLNNITYLRGKKERKERLEEEIHKKKKEFIYPDLRLTFHLTFRSL